MDDEVFNLWFSTIVIVVSNEIDDGFAGGTNSLGSVKGERAGSNWASGKSRVE